MTERKLFYVTFANQQAYSGGTQCANRNLRSIQAVLGTENVYACTLTPVEEKRSVGSKLKRGIDIVNGYFGGLTPVALQSILRQLEKGGFSDVFIDNSQLGLIAKEVKLRFPHIRIYVFFHNVEYDFMRSTVTKEHDHAHLFWLPLAKRNEQWACLYADKIVTLTTSDSSRLLRLYGREADMVIPVTMVDDYVPPTGISASTLSQTGKDALFVGSYFPGNTQGLIWFCKNVLPLVDIHLTVVGAGMDALACDLPATEKLSVYSNVPNLVPYYEQADFVLLPIISGGGMKVKTAEALKYGKYIVGTREALAGYDVDSRMATVCTTAADFIGVVSRSLPHDKFCQASREVFESKYSFDASLIQFSKLLT